MSDALRAALSRFCTGVVVVSTDHDDDVHAMTANAFTSVSLSPPLVLVSIAHRARMHALLPTSGRFGVSVLGFGSEAVAKHFAGQPGCPARFERQAGVPVLADAIATFSCRLETTHDVADHTLYIGRVVDFHAEDGAPLLFNCGRFAEVAPASQLTAR